MKRTIEVRAPMTVRITAEYALLCNNILWPGRDAKE